MSQVFYLVVRKKVGRFYTDDWIILSESNNRDALLPPPHMKLFEGEAWKIIEAHHNVSRKRILEIAKGLV